MKKIGVVGLGIMGRGIADNFLQKGYQVFVWNRTKTVSESFAVKGAVACGSPAEVAKNADVVFEVTANDASSQEVWLGATGILAGSREDSILIASATLSVEWIDTLIQACQKQHRQFFDMALTGGRVGAETGALTLLCGGDETVLNELRPTLAAIATKVSYFGAAGQGMRYKLILNFLQATHIVAFGEALKMAKAYNMNLQQVGDSLTERPGGVITQLAWRDYQKTPEPINFSIQWIAKDLSYAKKLAQDLSVPVLDEVLAEYQKALENGHAKQDWARVAQLNEVEK